MDGTVSPTVSKILHIEEGKIWTNCLMDSFSDIVVAWEDQSQHWSSQLFTHQTRVEQQEIISNTGLRGFEYFQEMGGRGSYINFIFNWHCGKKN